MFQPQRLKATGCLPVAERTSHWTSPKMNVFCEGVTNSTDISWSNVIIVGNGREVGLGTIISSSVARRVFLGALTLIERAGVGVCSDIGGKNRLLNIAWSKTVN